MFTAGASFAHGTGNTHTSSLTYSQRGGWGFEAGGGPTSLYEERYTGLASLLAPPVEPIYRSPWGWISLGWVGFWSLGVLFEFGMLNSTAPFIRDSEVLSQLGVALFLVVSVVFTKLYDSRNRHASVATRHPLWRKLMETWDAAYYCHKDGIVFVPGQRGQVPAPEFPAIMAVPNQPNLPSGAEPAEDYWRR